MDISSFLGIALGLALIAGAILCGGSLEQFCNLPGILIVVGGTLSVIVFSFSFTELWATGKLLGKVFLHRTPDHLATISRLINLGKKVRVHGWMSLKHDLGNETDEFLRKGIAMLLDNAETGVLLDTLRLEIVAVRERHRKGQQVFKQMARLSPAFGMLGTIVGLIQMLNVLNDPSSIGPKMAMALLTTFYGILLATILFNPIASKLQSRTEDEILARTIILNGLLAIADKHSPYQLEDRLAGFLTHHHRERLGERLKEVQQRLTVVA